MYMQADNQTYDIWAYYTGTKTQLEKSTPPSHWIIKEGRVLTGSEVMQSVRDRDANKNMEKLKEQRKRKIEKEEQCKKKLKT